MGYAFKYMAKIQSEQLLWWDIIKRGFALERKMSKVVLCTVWGGLFGFYNVQGCDRVGEGGRNGGGDSYMCNTQRGEGIHLEPFWGRASVRFMFLGYFTTTRSKVVQKVWSLPDHLKFIGGMNNFEGKGDSHERGKAWE